MSLVHDIDLSKRNKTVTSALLMDVKGAFDNVSKDRLLHTMFSLGLPPSLLSWTNHFMTYRKTSLAFDGNREPLLPVQTGIPQGSPISPILFLIYLRPLFDELNARYPFAQCPSYIDDVAIVVEGRNEIENTRLLGEIARYVFTWADKNAITFDGPKTELIHFIRRRQPSPDPDSSVYLPNGFLIEPSSCVRWLGVWLDSRLSFHNHIKAKTTAATRSYFALRRLANTQKGLTVSIMRQLYISTVLPILDYGSEVWWMGQKTAISKLVTVQNGAMRSILRAFKTTPIAALESEAAIVPTDLRLTHHQRKYALRILTLPSSHPIRQRCPSSLPPGFETEREDDQIRGQAWHSADSDTHFETWLDRLLL